MVPVRAQWLSPGLYKLTKDYDSNADHDQYKRVTRITARLPNNRLAIIGEA